MAKPTPVIALTSGDRTARLGAKPGDRQGASAAGRYRSTS